LTKTTTKAAKDKNTITKESGQYFNSTSQAKFNMKIYGAHK